MSNQLKIATSERINPDVGNWRISTRSSSAKRYALALVYADPSGPTLFDTSIFPNGVLDNNVTSWAPGKAITEFEFNVNPRSLGLEEPPAVNIVPTQDGGQFIEHQGQIYKNITISGTTGLRPNKNTIGGFAPVVIDPDRGLPIGERTGFDDLVALINFFRFYSDNKKNPAVSHNIIMIWQNGREEELFIVEPINFRTTRDAASPLTTDYEITLKTINKLENGDVFNRVEDPFRNRNSKANEFTRISDKTRKLSRSVLELNSRFDTAVSTGQKIISRIYQPVGDILDQLTSFLSTTQRVFQVPRSALAQLIRDLDELFVETQALAVSYQTFGITDQYSQLAQSLRNTQRAIAGIFAEDILFINSPNVKLNAKVQTYNKFTDDTGPTGGDPNLLENESGGSGVGESTINNGETIRKVANRLLGNSSRWKILVILNKLKPPYLSPTGDGISILRPGDKILFPIEGAVPSTNVKPETTGERKQNPIEERLGRDLKISANQAVSGIGVFDMQVNNKGDLTTVEGSENLIQAVIIKFETEQGEQPLHPNFGLQFPIGVKFTGSRSIIAYQIAAKTSILNDERIDQINNFKFSLAGNTVTVKAEFSIKGFDDPLSIDFNVLR